MHITAERVIDEGIVEREFTLAGTPGWLWTPADRPPVAGWPLVLMGHPGGLSMMYPRLEARARHAAALGMASATLELPGSGQRTPLASVDQARADLREALAIDARPTDEVINRLILPLVEQSVPEWSVLLDELLQRPGLSGAAAISGGVTAIGVRLALVDPRIRAASLFAGSYLPRTTFDEARGVSIPIHVFLQWDDRGNDRQAALDLFDAFGSREKTLQANTGGHTGIPAYAAEDAGRFLLRHLQ